VDPNTQVGPLVSREQQERVLGYIESGRKDGATVTVGGEAPSAPGFYVKPTMLTNVHNFVDPNMPFGGFKQSGFGREHGCAVLDLYTELKSVCVAI
jgi:acyl-CoA reductase-like NAD-dependent aldehyde dehydrogenase